MEAIILAGGFGTRLRQLVSDLPKPMAPIAGRPFLEILLTSLASKGFKRVILSVGYMSDKISNYFGRSFDGVELLYAIEDEPLGTGGGVRQSMDMLINDHVFVFNGDTFLDVEVKMLEKCWHARKRPIIIGRQVSNTSRYGRLLEFEGIATGFDEKGIAGPGLINAGCYVLQKGQLDRFPLRHAFSLETDFLASAVSQGEFDVFITKGLFIDIGVPEDFLLAQTELANY
jgi:D-glycero-alpha-D-manno-heptose 1-phosphate guanylyltransferase